VIPRRYRSASPVVSTDSAFAGRKRDRLWLVSTLTLNNGVVMPALGLGVLQTPPDETRDPKAEVLPVCEELGIGFVPWSLLGQRFLPGTVGRSESFSADDIRSRFPRFTPEALKANQPIVDLVKEIAGRKQVTPGQVALAWLLAKSPSIVPIPGSRRSERGDREHPGRRRDPHCRRGRRDRRPLRAAHRGGGPW